MIRHKFFKFFIFCLCTASTISGYGQSHLNNASFEGQAQDATMPSGWFACELGTTPDILPGFWGVATEPSEGSTYMGLITREDGSYESVGQRLKDPLKQDYCYEFEFDLCRSNTYEGYNFPIRLMIWGGKSKCNKDQLLYSSPTIEHTDWKTYKVKFDAKQKIRYIILEAYFGDGLMFKYKGNILIDAMSRIKVCTRA